MGKSIKVKVYLDDLFENGLEPEKGRAVFKDTYSVNTDTYKITTHSVEHKINEIGKYGGMLTEGNRWHTIKGKWEAYHTDGCFVYLNVKLLVDAKKVRQL